MLIYTDYNKPFLIEKLNSPIVAEYYWGFSGSILDYTLIPITYLEETIGPSVKILIEGFEFIVPATWSVLVMDPETAHIDAVPISNCSLNDYNALLMSSVDSKIRTSPIQVMDLIPDDSCVHPMIPKGTMMCHPIGPSKSRTDIEENILNISIGPHDLYSKYLNGKSVGDIVE